MCLYFHRPHSAYIQIIKSIIYRLINVTAINAREYTWNLSKRLNYCLKFCAYYTILNQAAPAAGDYDHGCSTSDQ